MVIIGSIPIVLTGVLGRDLIKGPLRSLWVVAIALIAWGGVMLVAEAVAKQNRTRADIGLKDAVIIGGTQALALIPGISRSGATISAGLMLGLDRVSAARYGFLLGIPALVGAAILELPDALRTGGVGAIPTLVGTAVSFVDGLPHVAWMLRFVARHTIRVFVWYRWALGAGADRRDSPPGGSPPRACQHELDDDGPAGPPRPVHREQRRRPRRAGAGVGLDETGCRQAARLRRAPADVPIDRLVSSPLERCRRTLEPLAERARPADRDRRPAGRGGLRRVDRSRAEGPRRGTIVARRAAPSRRGGVPGGRVARGGVRAGGRGCPGPRRGSRGRRSARERQAVEGGAMRGPATSPTAMNTG